SSWRGPAARVASSGSQPRASRRHGSCSPTCCSAWNRWIGGDVVTATSRRSRSGPNPPGLTTIVVNWNTVGLLDDCLRSIVAATPRGLRNEIIVVDNASSDDSVAYLRQHWPEL